MRDRAPILLRCPLSLENAISIRFRSGECGGRDRNQQPCALRAAAASLFRWVARLSRITAVQGAISGIRASRTKAANAVLSIAPLMNHSAISTSQVSPAIRVWVPQCRRVRPRLTVSLEELYPAAGRGLFSRGYRPRKQHAPACGQ